MQDLSLHILDIVENSLQAGATLVEISLSIEKDRLDLTVKDNGRGMSEQELQKARDAFFSTKGKRWGLGIPLLAQSAQEAEGALQIHSQVGKGTTLRLHYRLSHPDAKPLGNLGCTMMTLLAGHPDVDFLLRLSHPGGTYTLDTRELRKAGLPLNSPKLVKLIRDEVNEALSSKEIREGGVLKP
jgi:hypothetical protein